MTKTSIRRGASWNTADIPVRQGGQFAIAIVPAPGLGSEYAAGRDAFLEAWPGCHRMAHHAGDPAIAALPGTDIIVGRVIVLPAGPSLGGDEAIASVAAIVGGGA